MNMGNLQEALAFYQKSLKLRSNSAKDKDPRMANLYINLGSVYNNKGKYKDALENYETGLKIFRSIHSSEEHAHIAMVYHQMGTTYNNRGNYKNALK